MWIYIIIAIVVLILIYFGITYNSFVKLNNTVKEAFSTIDIYLKKRWDLIPNIVEIVKGYVKHEKSTLAEIVELRSSNYDNMSRTEKFDINNKLSQRISKLMAISEAYPDLKANENFRTLIQQLTKIEDDITNSRKYYNGTVKMFNNRVQTFPNNIVTKILGFKEQKMFEASETERENVEIKM